LGATSKRRVARLFGGMVPVVADSLFTALPSRADKRLSANWIRGMARSSLGALDSSKRTLQGAGKNLRREKKPRKAFPEIAPMVNRYIR